MKIVTKKPLILIATDLGVKYHWLWECVRFKRKGMSAIQLRNKILQSHPSTVINYD